MTGWFYGGKIVRKLSVIQCGVFFHAYIFLSKHYKWWQLLPWQEFQCRKIAVLVSAWKTTAINNTDYLSHILFVHAFLGERLNRMKKILFVFLCYIFFVQLSIVSIVKTKYCTFIVCFTIHLLSFLTITNVLMMFIYYTWKIRKKYWLQNISLQYC